MEEYSVIGKRVPLKDAPEKVTGRATFVADMKLPGMLHVKILRSPYPHAKILRVDVSKAEAFPGVKAVLSKNNAPWVKMPVTYGGPRDKRAFDEKVRYVGDEVAAVAAVSKKVAKEALKLIKVDYEKLPAVLDPEEAMKPDAPLIHEDKAKNIGWPTLAESGDVEAGFAEADHVFEETFRTPAQRHASLETHCCIASFDATGKLTVWSPTQNQFHLRGHLAEYMDLPMSKVRVIKPYLGGGFGSKLDMLVEHICALLAKMTGQPVRLVLTREEEFSATLSRLASIVKLKLGVKRDGTLTGIKANVVSSTGAYMYKPAVMMVTVRTLISIYRCSNVKAEGYCVYTNLISAGAMRGFGSPQAHFAMESMMDIIADKLGIDPVELRLKNSKNVGDTSMSGTIIGSCGLAECLAKGAEQIGLESGSRVEKVGDVKQQGIGMACFTHRGGTVNTMPDYSAAFVKLNEDGTAHLFTGVADLGTGSYTTLAQIAAEELGLSLDAVDVIAGDTDNAPHDEGAYASRTLYVAGSAVKAAAADAREQLLSRAAEKLNVTPADLNVSGGRIFVRENPEMGVAVEEVTREAREAKKGAMTFLGKATFENYNAAQSFGAQFAKVEVDTETGEVQVLKMVAIHDIGKAINPMVVEGQIEGGLQQSIGYALMEDPIFDEKTGRMLNPNFADYMVPTALDMPHIEMGLVETNEPSGPFGAKSTGELTVLGGAPAIANAIYDAIGIRFTELPITPERVFRALKGKGRSTSERRQGGQSKFA